MHACASPNDYTKEWNTNKVGRIMEGTAMTKIVDIEAQLNAAIRAYVTYLVASEETQWKS